MDVISRIFVHVVAIEIKYQLSRTYSSSLKFKIVQCEFLSDLARE